MMHEEMLFLHGGPTANLIREALARLSGFRLEGRRVLIEDRQIHFDGVWTHRFILRLLAEGLGNSSEDVLIMVSAQEDSGERNTSQLSSDTKYSVVRFTVDNEFGTVSTPMLRTFLDAALKRFSEQFSVHGANIVVKPAA